MAGFWGLDADSWGNVIAAFTGAGAIVSGVVTFTRTSKLNRDARSQDAKDARAAELRSQGRAALAEVAAAASRYLDLCSGARLGVIAPAQGFTEHSALKVAELREITRATLLVTETDRREGLALAMEAMRLVPYYAIYDDWEPRDVDLKRERVVERVRALAAAYLREDGEGAAAELRWIHDDVAAGRETEGLFQAQEDEEREADRKARRVERERRAAERSGAEPTAP